MDDMTLTGTDPDAAFKALVINGTAMILAEMGEVLPHFVIETSAGERHVFPLAPERMDDENYKNAACTALRHVARQMDVARYVFVTEAWVATAVPGDDRAPADRPDREEVVTIVGGSRGSQIFVMRAIVRDGENVALGTEELAPVGVSAGGRFSNLLDNPN